MKGKASRTIRVILHFVHLSFPIYLDVYVISLLYFLAVVNKTFLKASWPPWLVRNMLLLYIGHLFHDLLLSVNRAQWLGKVITDSQNNLIYSAIYLLWYRNDSAANWWTSGLGRSRKLARLEIVYQFWGLCMSYLCLCYWGSV